MTHDPQSISVERSQSHLLGQTQSNPLLFDTLFFWVWPYARNILKLCGEAVCYTKSISLGQTITNQRLGIINFSLSYISIFQSLYSPYNTSLGDQI